MPVLFPLLGGLLLSLLPATAQTPATAPPAPDAGMASYRSDALHLSYSYPASYRDAGALVDPAFQASTANDPTMAQAVRCLSHPLSRMSTAGGQVAVLLLVRVDAGCMKRKFNAGSLPELTEGEAKGLSASGAKVAFDKPVAFQVAGKPASFTKGSFSLLTGQTLQSLVTCVLDEPDVACWQFLSNTPEALRTMSAFPVTFDGQPPAPLVPAELLNGTK